MDAVVDTLRANYDTRWGYNCKRGNCGDPSLDVIAYHYSGGNDEGNTDVYIIDIIGGHCGSSPVPVWNDVTAVTTANAAPRAASRAAAASARASSPAAASPSPPLPPVSPGTAVARERPHAGPDAGLPAAAAVLCAGDGPAARGDGARHEDAVLPARHQVRERPWQDYIVDGLRKIDSRWGYNAKPTRTAGDNGGVPVVAAGDEIMYHWGAGRDQGSTEVYSIDILAGHCGSTPSLTWRDFTGEEAVIWTGAGRF